MADIVVDFATGSAGGDGSWGSPYKTTGDIPAISPGDHIKLGKSPANTAISSNLLWTDGSTTVVASGVDVTGEIAVGAYIAKSTAAVGSAETFYRVTARAYSGGDTTITIGCAYVGTTATVASVVVGVTDVGTLAAISTPLNVITSSGTHDSPILVSGGWNLSTHLQDGETRYWQSGSNAYGYAFSGNSSDCVQYSKIAALRFYRFYTASSCDEIAMTDITVCSGGSYAISMQAGHGWTLTRFISVNNSSGSITMDDASYCRIIDCWLYKGTSGLNLGRVRRCTIAGTSMIGCNGAIRAATHCHDVIVADCTFSGNSSDIVITASLHYEDVLSLVRTNGVDGVAVVYYEAGVAQRDDANYRTAGGSSWKWTPASATQHCEDTLAIATVTADTAYTLGIYARKDGTFNGAVELLVYNSDGEIVSGPTAQVLTTDYAQYTLALAAADVPETGVARLAVRVTGTAGNVWFADPSIVEA